MKNCELCKLEGCKFKLTICRTCGIPLIVSVDHKPEFSEEEKELIKKMFPNRKIRWKMRSLKGHAHLHLE